MAETSEKSFPFDSDQQNGVYDREYMADDFATYFRAFISSGTFMKKSTNLQVIANGDMSVTLKPGSMIIDGYRYENTADIIIQLSPADGVTNRVDRISITWSKEDRDNHCTVQEGTSSYNPEAPECRRTADYKDYVVADIMVAAGAITISQADITDQRLNTELCGLATAFCDIDTTSIFNQFTAWFNDTKAAGESDIEEMLSDYTAWIAQLEEEETAECNALVSAMQNLLEGSAAGKLQIEIDEAAKTEFMRYTGLVEQETEFLADGSIKTVNEAAVITTTKGTDTDGNKTITEVVKPVSETDLHTYTKTTTFYPKTETSNKKIKEVYIRE